MEYSREEREEAGRLFAAWGAAMDAYRQCDGTDKEAVARYANAERVANDAYESNPLPAVLTQGEWVAMRCAVSGMVLLEDDEFLEDEETGECVLRSAIGLPPRPTGDV
jgi:hypothetical protein